LDLKSTQETTFSVAEPIKRVTLSQVIDFPLSALKETCHLPAPAETKAALARSLRGFAGVWFKVDILYTWLEKMLDLGQVNLRVGRDTMLSWLELSRSAIRQNYLVFKDMVAPFPLMPIVKSNAYGHGLEQVMACLKDEDLSWVGVNYLSEAKKIRESGYSGDILVVGPYFKEHIPEAFSLKATLFLSHFDSVEAWTKLDLKPKVHIKVDTGMSRQGFLLGDLPELIQRLEPYKKMVQGVATHFSNVEDVLDHAYADGQMAEFEQAQHLFKEAGFQPLLAHAASSASTLILKPSRYDLCRVGISLYGFWPSQMTKVSFHQLHSKVASLLPALSWKAPIAQVKEVKAGRHIGYGLTFKAPKDMTIAVLPVGYFEGYPRLAGSAHSYVLVDGQRCPIVGRICMNMMMIDISHIAKPHVGQTATLIGKDGAEEISASEIAAWSETIHYEFVSRLHPDIPRRIVS
jgi:alanine racemase